MVVINAQSIERQKKQQRKNREKKEGHKRARESEWDWEKRDWQWRMQAVKDICRVICYYRKRETNSFFLLFFSNSKIKTLINLNQQGSRTSPFICQTLDGEGLFLPPLVHSSHRGRRHPSRGMLGNLAWPETWRWWTDGGGTLCYLLLT